MDDDVFEPIPQGEPPRATAIPPWVAPPAGTLPGIAALELVLARSPTAAVYLSRLCAYPSGFEIDLLTVAHPDADALDPALFGPHRRRPGAPDERLRLGVQFADGAKAANVGGEPSTDPSVRPAAPVLRLRGGGGGGGNWRQRFWIWPLPPPGDLAFVCEWPAAGIPVTRHEIDAGLVLDAARRALVIFDQPAAARGDSSGDAFGAVRRWG